MSIGGRRIPIGGMPDGCGAIGLLATLPAGPRSDQEHVWQVGSRYPSFWKASSCGGSAECNHPDSFPWLSTCMPQVVRCLAGCQASCLPPPPLHSGLRRHGLMQRTLGHRMVGWHSAWSSRRSLPKCVALALPITGERAKSRWVCRLLIVGGESTTILTQEACWMTSRGGESQDHNRPPHAVARNVCSQGSTPRGAATPCTLSDQLLKTS